MNQLVNIIYLFFALMYILPKISEYAKEPMYKKLFFIVIVFGLEAIFDAFFKLIKKEKITLNSLLDKALMHSLLLLLGLLLFTDLKESPSLMSQIPGLDKIIDLETTKLAIYMIPLIFFTTSKCFLKSY